MGLSIPRLKVFEQLRCYSGGEVGRATVVESEFQAFSRSNHVGLVTHVGILLKWL